MPASRFRTAQIRRRTQLVVITGIVTSFAVIPSTAEAANCTRHINDVETPGPALEEPITLSPAVGSEQRSKNFDAKRGTKDIKDVRINSDKRLPDSITPSQLNFESLIQRSEDKLESVDFPDPTFTDPRISADRKHLVFTICLNANGMDAGKYVGNVAVNGPDGLGEARVGITANLKVNFLIWFGLTIIAILFAGGALVWKARSAGTATDGGWWFKTVAALVVAFGALSVAYSNDPAWGAGLFNSAIALVGTALASIGGRKLLE